MAHHNTVFSQLLKFIPRHEFEALASQHHQGRKLRKMSRWSQFVTLGIGQLSGRRSLRDIVTNVSAQARKLYHLGASKVSRSSLVVHAENSVINKWGRVYLIYAHSKTLSDIQ